MASADCLWISSVLSESLKIGVSLRRLSSRNKKLPLPLPVERPQSTHKAFRPHISGTDKSPTAPKAPRHSPHIRDIKVFGNSLGNISRIWANHILTVSSGSSSIQVLWEFWGSFFQALYWITLSIKSSYFYAELLQWPVFHNLHIYTEKNIILYSKGVSVKAPWNSVQNLITFLLGFSFCFSLGRCLFLSSSRCQLCCLQ